MKTCGYKDEDGNRHGVPHNESGPYCAEHRREYQRNRTRGILLKGDADTTGSACCKYCDKPLRTNGKASSEHCKICEGTIAHLKTLRADQIDALVKATRPTQTFEVSDEDIAFLLGNQ